MLAGRSEAVCCGRVGLPVRCQREGCSTFECAQILNVLKFAVALPEIPTDNQDVIFRGDVCNSEASELYEGVHFEDAKSDTSELAEFQRPSGIRGALER